MTTRHCLIGQDLEEDKSRKNLGKSQNSLLSILGPEVFAFLTFNFDPHQKLNFMIYTKSLKVLRPVPSPNKMV